MTELEVLKECAKVYQFGIDNLPIEQDDRDIFLKEKFIGCGICLLSRWKFRFILSEKIFINYFVNSSYICKTPIYEPYDLAKEYLQIRLNVLNEIIENYERSR